MIKLGKLIKEDDYKFLKKHLTLSLISIFDTKTRDNPNLLEHLNSMIEKLQNTLNTEDDIKGIIRQIFSKLQIMKDATGECLLYFNDEIADKNFRTITYGNTEIKGDPILLQMINLLKERFQWQ